MDIEEKEFLYEKYLNFYDDVIKSGRHRRLSFNQFCNGSAPGYESQIFVQIYYIYKKDYARIIDRDTKIDNILK